MFYSNYMAHVPWFFRLGQKINYLRQIRISRTLMLISPLVLFAGAAFSACPANSRCVGPELHEWKWTPLGPSRTFGEALAAYLNFINSIPGNDCAAWSIKSTSFRKPLFSGNFPNHLQMQVADVVFYHPANDQCSAGSTEKDFTGWRDVVCPPNSYFVGDGQCAYTLPPKKNPCAQDGNPIYIGDGDKIQVERDTVETKSRLGFVRYYNSESYNRRLPDSSGGVGEYTVGGLWLSNLDSRLLVPDSGEAARTVFLLRPDGSSLAFAASEQGYTGEGLLDYAAGRSPGPWRYVGTNGDIEYYSDAGLLVYSGSAEGDYFSISWGAKKDGNGKVVNNALGVNQVVDPWGRKLVFFYDDGGRLASVVDPAGLKTTYQYLGGGGVIDRVFRPGGVVAYKYGEPENISSNSGNFPPYVERLLTGIVDEAGSRFGTYTYKFFGKPYAISTKTGGLPATEVSYLYSAVDVISSAKIKRPNGSSFDVNFSWINGKNVVISNAQPAGAGCAASSSKIEYDADGNKILEDDFNGNRTCYVRTASGGGDGVSVSGLIKRRIDGLVGIAGVNDGSTPTECSSVASDGATLPTGGRKISTQWHPQWVLKIKEAQPYLITTWVYNGQPDPFNGGATARCITAKYGSSNDQPKLPDGSDTAVLCKKVEQATTDTTGEKGFAAAFPTVGDVKQRQWEYTYNQYGQVLTATDPMGQKTAYTYRCEDRFACEGVNKFVFTGSEPREEGYYQGDLWKVANAAGHVVEFVSYDRSGRVIEMKDANGLQTKLSYSPRGLITEVNQGGLKTSYDYWPTGLLKKSTQPDGSYLYYRYDDAHRLTSVSDQVDGDGNPTGNTVTYTLDNMGNRKAEQLNDVSTAITRYIQRDYDALNRLKSIYGAVQ